MRRFSSTWLMFLVVALLAGYTAWDYRKAVKEEGVDADQEKRLFAMEPGDVEEIKVQQKDDLVDIKKENGVWHMLKPVDDEADSSAVEAFNYSTVIQKGKFFRSEDDAKNTKWADYGLDPVTMSVEVKSAKKSESLQVSSKNAFDGSYYVRKGDELLLGDRGLAQIVARSPNSLRQRRLWRDTESTIERADVEVDYEGLKEKFAILLKDGKWELGPKPAFDYDLERTANWLVQLERMTAQEIEIDLDTPAADAKDIEVPLRSLGIPMHFKRAEGPKAGPWTFAKQTLRVTLHLKDAKGAAGTWILTAGPDIVQDGFVMANARSTVYKIPAQNLLPFRIPIDYFRNGKKPFNFPVEQARRIEVFNEGKQRTFIKENSDWKLEGGDSVLQPDKLVALIQNIHQLEAAEFVPQAKAKGFSAQQRVVVRDDKGAVLLDLSWGDPFPATRKYNKGMTLCYVRTNLEKDAMGVNQAAIASLNIALTEKKSPTKTETEKASKK